MSADATRWEFGVRVDDPRQALEQLADTIVLVDDIDTAIRQFDWVWFSPEDADRWHLVVLELRNLRQRLEAIHARLVT